MSEKQDAALESIAELIRIELTTRHPQRFFTAARYCAVAQQLIQASGERVEDFENDPNNMGVFGNADGGIDIVGGLGQYIGPRMPARYRGQRQVVGPLDANQVTRDMILTAQAVLGNLGEQAVRKAARDTVEELSTLAELPEDLRNDPVIQARIAGLKQKIKERTTADAAAADLVSSDVPRGRAAQGEVEERDGGLVREPDPLGGGGAAGAAGGRHEEGVGLGG